MAQKQKTIVKDLGELQTRLNSSKGMTEEEARQQDLRQRYMRRAKTERCNFGIRIGDRLRFTGTSWHWFTDMIANAERDLKVGEIYTLKSISVASSWTGITLDETGDIKYCLSWFEEHKDPK